MGLLVKLIIFLGFILNNCFGKCVLGISGKLVIFKFLLVKKRFSGVLEVWEMLRSNIFVFKKFCGFLLLLYLIVNFIVLICLK